MGYFGKDSYDSFAHGPQMAKSARQWTRSELLLTFELYCKTPFGRLHRRNPAVTELASLIGRTPSAVAMKLVNFASLDESQKSRGIKGLSNASRSDALIADEFKTSWDSLALEAAECRTALVAARDLQKRTINGLEAARSFPVTERVVIQKQRVVQSFFRDTVIANFDVCCAICDNRHPQLLVASHIIPWAMEITRRADPTNGLCLCAIHDRAFDRGLIAVDESFRVLVSSSLSEVLFGSAYDTMFGKGCNRTSALCGDAVGG